MRRERLMRCAQSKKKNTPCISRPHVSNIAQNRISHLGGEGKLLTSPVFQPTDTNLFIDPVQVIECQSADLPYTEAVYRKEQNDCAIANVSRTVCVEIGNQPLDLFPAWTFGKTGQ